MPELPEVETIRLGLSRKIIGLKIKKVQVINPKSFIGNPKILKGQKVLNVWRRGKVLGIQLFGNITLLFHLKMSGQLIFTKGQKPGKHTRVILDFDNGFRLFFNDQRKFGWVKVTDNSQLEIGNFFKKLGPEPLEKDFSWQVFKSNLMRHKSLPVKAAIMDQTVVAGVGNIYAAEALFLAQIHPGKKVGVLSGVEIKKLHRGIIKSLQDGIAYRGSTMTHFKDTEGKKGDFLSHAFVYRREGEKCKKCKSMIEKIRISGRGTYLCPNCQSGVQ